MRDFLIDTNIWEYWFNPNRKPQHKDVLRRVEGLKAECELTGISPKVWISSITWGKIEYGYQAQTDDQRTLEGPFKAFIRDIAPKEFIVDRHVTREYGRIRAKLFEKYGPNGKKKKGLRPEQLIDPVTSLQLRIQENDLWIVAQAITKDLILVTNDRKSLRPLLEVTGGELHIENWAEEKAY